MPSAAAEAKTRSYFIATNPNWTQSSTTTPSNGHALLLGPRLNWPTAAKSLLLGTGILEFGWLCHKTSLLSSSSSYQNGLVLWHTSPWFTNTVTKHSLHGSEGGGVPPVSHYQIRLHSIGIFSKNEIDSTSDSNNKLE
jgi:hypothetical protein